MSFPYDSPSPMNFHKMISHAERNNWSCLVLGHLFASYNECHCFKEMIDMLKEQEKALNVSQQGILFREHEAQRLPSPSPCRHAPVPTYPHPKPMSSSLCKTTLRAQPFHLQTASKVGMLVTLRTRSQFLS